MDAKEVAVLIGRGRGLSGDDLVQLEDEAVRTESLELRCVLLGALAGGSAGRIIPHVLWTIEHHPSVFLGPCGRIPAPSAAFETGRATWLRHVERAPEDARIAFHAAYFLASGACSAEAIELLERGLRNASESRRPDWARALIDLLELEMVRVRMVDDVAAIRSLGGRLFNAYLTRWFAEACVDDLGPMLQAAVAAGRESVTSIVRVAVRESAGVGQPGPDGSREKARQLRVDLLVRLARIQNDLLDSTQEPLAQLLQDSSVADAALLRKQFASALDIWPSFAENLNLVFQASR